MATKQWVVAFQDLPKATVGADTGNAEVVLLVHPRTNRLAPFMFVSNNVYELQASYPVLGEEKGYASWFVGNSVVGDGTLLMATPVDPLFLALPILSASADKMRPLDQLFVSAKAPEARRLTKCANIQLNYVCDVNDKYGPDSIFYRYSETKALGWLRKKVDRLANKISTMDNLDCTKTSGTVSSFVSASGAMKKTADPASKMKSSRLQALKFLREYLTDTMLEKLATVYEVKIDLIMKKKKLLSPKKKVPAPQSRRSTMSADDAFLEDMIEEEMSATATNAPVRKTNSCETVVASPPPRQSAAQSRWDMQMDVSGDNMNSLLNMAPAPMISKRAGEFGGSNIVKKKAKVNPKLASVKVKSKSMLSFFTKKK